MDFSWSTAFIMILALIVYMLIIRERLKRVLIICILVATLVIYWSLAAIQSKGIADKGDINDKKSLIESVIHVENTRRDFVIGALLMDEKIGKTESPIYEGTCREGS